MSDSPPIRQQVLDAIGAADVRAKVGLVIEFCVTAVADLDSLDHNIYERVQAAEAAEGEALSNRDALEALAANVLGGVRALASYLLRSDDEEEEEAEDDSSLDFDFDLGGPAAAPEDMTLDEDDIDSVLDGFAPASRQSSDERWAALSSEMQSLAYALSAQLDDFDQRFTSSLDQGRIPQALRELDDVGNALIDGVFALMSTICETYLESFDRDQILPGHRDALGKALLVRRGVAALRGVIKEVNARIQDSDLEKEERETDVNTVVEALSMFLESEVWKVMRPADRMELRRFRDDTAEKSFKQAALCCEGLDKYLDSLLSVNQRDVLIRHDRELMGEIAATLEGVAPLVDISPHGAMDMVHQAFGKAEALYGYSDALDELLVEWQQSYAESSDPAALVEVSGRLAAIAEMAIR